ncbi:DNA independent RNA polymerase I transcription factor [Diaporthe eres]
MEAHFEDRPSFTSFWRKTKDESTARELTFVQSDPSQSNSKAPGQAQEPGQASKDKRRIQVRKAQVAHRQRKAKYVEQLEADIAGIRDKISHAESARQVLRDENEAIRAQLSAAAAAAAAASAYTQAPAPALQLSYMPPYLHSNLQYQDQGLGMDQFDAMNLNIDASLDTFPSYYVSESSPFASSGVGSSLGGSPQCLATSGGSSPYPYLPDM